MSEESVALVTRIIAMTPGDTESKSVVMYVKDATPDYRRKLKNSLTSQWHKAVERAKDRIDPRYIYEVETVEAFTRSGNFVITAVAVCVDGDEL